MADVTHEVLCVQCKQPLQYFPALDSFCIHLVSVQCTQS